MSVVESIGQQKVERIRRAAAAVVDFYQASCPPCRVLEPRLEKVAGKYMGRVPVYRVDVDRDMPIAESFGVRSLPTILVLRNGREVDRLDGLITDQALESAFKRVAGKP